MLSSPLPGLALLWSGGPITWGPIRTEAVYAEATEGPSPENSVGAVG